jgi:hypothetical protein
MAFFYDSSGVQHQCMVLRVVTFFPLVYITLPIYHLPNREIDALQWSRYRFRTKPRPYRLLDVYVHILWICE